MKLVIKIGGSLLDDARTRESIARQLADVAARHQVVVVHGGGQQMTQFLDERGVKSRFSEGLRISDEAVIDALLKVVAGSVNKRLVSSLIAAGAMAVGLSGIDGMLTVAKQMDTSLGFVGKPGSANARLLDVLLNAGYVPVIACLAADRDGAIYNVNADQMAACLASGWGAEGLLFLTDVAGVQDAAGSVLRRLATEQIAVLIETGVVRGGMQAKLNAASEALRSGVGEVIIAPGGEPGICARLLSGANLGTRLSLARIPERSVTA